MENKKFDVVIIGAGPAGLTAGIYLSRAKVKTLILDEGMPGGQIILSHEIANYPGVENVSGYALASTMKKQAETFGCVVKRNAKITNFDLSSEKKTIEINNGKEIFETKVVIISTGGKSRPLGIPGENKFKGRGVSYCATCDGDFYQGKEIIVVGGGNSALEEAVALTKYAKVTIVHQFDHFQAFKHAIEDAEKNDKIDFIMESELQEINGDNVLEYVTIKNMKTGAISTKKIDGVFVFIGYIPNTEMFANVLNLNERKEIISNETLETNIKGVFVAGDNRNKKIRQITTAVSDGTIAASNAIEFLNSL
jgi:thioredoxin reductase (NADPH)